MHVPYLLVALYSTQSVISLLRPMREWIVGAFINLIGSIAINFGTNLLKLGHNERERHLMLEGDGSNGKFAAKPIMYFQTWRIGLVFFALGNCFNFVSFGYAAQSLLAALGSVQFVSNIAFAYFVLNKAVTVRVLVATTFIVLGNIFLVAFGNHQSPVFTPEQLAEKFSNTTFLFYCLTLIIVVVVHHMFHKRGEQLFASSKQDIQSYWHLLLPFSYAIVSGAIGSCSVLFAKSLSNLLRLSMSSGYQFHTWFSYSMLLLFFSTAGFWMARLNEGLSLFDAILIVPMFQIAWTFFSICTGFIYFQEYQVLDKLRTTMFILGMVSVFIGISLLAPDDIKGNSGVEVKETALETLKPTISSTVTEGWGIPHEDIQINDIRSFIIAVKLKAVIMVAKAKAAISISVGLGDHSLNASAILVMPMVSSKPTSGFRGKTFSFKNHPWSKIALEEGESKIVETTALL